MDDTGEVPCQPIYLLGDLHPIPTIAFALGRMRQLLSNGIKTKQQAADAVAGELVSDCTRKGNVATSGRAVSRRLMSELDKNKALKRKLSKLPSGKKRDDALREGKAAILKPMDVRNSTGNLSTARASAEPPRKAFLTSLKRNSEIEDRSPLLPGCSKDDSPYLNLRGGKDAAKVRPRDPPPPPPSPALSYSPL
jgi:hypothetical protein